MGKQSIEGAVRVCPEGRRPEPEWARELGGYGLRGDLTPADGRAPTPTHQGLLDCIQESLGATEAEWKVVEPQLARVMALLRQTGSRPHMAFDPSAPRGGLDMGRGPEMRARQLMGELAEATEALETTLDDAETPAEEIRARLKVLREIRRRGKQRLAEARAVLLGLVAPRQEAQLLLMGILD